MDDDRVFAVESAILRKIPGRSWRLTFGSIADPGADKVVADVSPGQIDEVKFEELYSLREINALSARD
jgi:hypothetical protein